jgi:hypothetical protein
VRVFLIYAAFAIAGTLVAGPIVVGLGLLGVMSPWLAQLGACLFIDEKI